MKSTHQKSQKEILDAYNWFNKLLSEHDPKTVIEHLKVFNGSIPLTADDQKLSTFIIRKTCAVYDVRPLDLTKKYVTGNMLDARTLCVILIKTHCQADNHTIARMFNKHSRQMVTQAFKELENKSETVPHEKVFLQKYKELEEKITLYKENGEDDKSK